MKDEEKNRTQLLAELKALRQQVSCLRSFIEKIQQKILNDTIQATRELQKVHGEIERRVEKRTAELIKANEALCIEISERMHAEKALQKSEEKYRRLTENARSMIYRQSLPDGQYEYVNPACVELTGYTPEEICKDPMHIRKTIHPDWADYLEKQWEKLLAGEVPPYYEYQIIHKIVNFCAIASYLL